MLMLRFLAVSTKSNVREKIGVDTSLTYDQVISKVTKF